MADETTGTIVVATPDPDLALLLELAIGGEGYSVLTVGNGKDALSLAFSRVPRALFLERELPGLSAEDVLKNLQSFEATRLIPVVISMNRPLNLADFPVVRVGVDHVIEKPLSLRKLRAVLASIRRVASETLR